MANPVNIRVANPVIATRNHMQIGWFITLATVILATTIGILGVEGILGFAFYIAGNIVFRALLLFYCFNGKASLYTGIESSSISWLFQGLGDNVLTFLLAWSTSYAIAHFF